MIGPSIAAIEHHAVRLGLAYQLSTEVAVYRDGSGENGLRLRRPHQPKVSAAETLS